MKNTFKKIFIILTSVFLILCVAACGALKQPTQSQPTAPVQGEPEPSAAPSVTITVYTGDETAEHFLTQDVSAAALDENSVFAALKSAGVMPDDVELLDGAGYDFDMDAVRHGRLSPVFFGSALTNFGVEPFLADFLRLSPPPLGTSGEYIAVGCLVNTYLTAFGADTVSITVNGAPLESGHNVYDMPLEFYTDSTNS